MCIYACTFSEECDPSHISFTESTPTSHTKHFLIWCSVLGDLPLFQKQLCVLQVRLRCAINVSWLTQDQLIADSLTHALQVLAHRVRKRFKKTLFTDLFSRKKTDYTQPNKTAIFHWYYRWMSQSFCFSIKIVPVPQLHWHHPGKGEFNLAWTKASSCNSKKIINNHICIALFLCCKILSTFSNGNVKWKKKLPDPVGLPFQWECAVGE